MHALCMHNACMHYANYAKIMQIMQVSKDYANHWHFVTHPNFQVADGRGLAGLVDLRHSGWHDDAVAWHPSPRLSSFQSHSSRLVTTVT